MISAYYLVVIEGEITPDLVGAFHGHEVTVGNGTTIVHAPGLDQAALHGLLDRTHDLGLTLLEVRIDQYQAP